MGRTIFCVRTDPSVLATCTCVMETHEIIPGATITQTKQTVVSIGYTFASYGVRCRNINIMNNMFIKIRIHSSYLFQLMVTCTVNRKHCPLSILSFCEV